MTIAQGFRSAVSRRGSALLTVIVLLITLTALAVSMTNLTVMGVREQVKRYDKVSLMVSAESAVNIAISDLQKNYKTRIATNLTENQVDGGDPSKYTYDVNLATYGGSSLNGVELASRIIRLNTDASNPDMIYFLIQGTATVGDPGDPMAYRRTRVETTIRPAPQNVFKQAMFALEGYNFMGAATTDSWNSTSGAYGTVPLGGEGDLASEGDIDVQKVYNVGGEIIDNQEMPLPLFSYADQVGTLASSGTLNDLYVKTYGTTVSGSLNALTLTAGSAYRFDSLALTNKSRLVLSGAGTVELFIDGTIDFKAAEMVYATSPNTVLKVYQGSAGGTAESSWDINTGTLGDVDSGGISGNNHPKNFWVLTEHAGTTTMNGNGVFCGVFFAPNSTIKFNGTFDFYGSVIARRYDSKLSTGTDEQGRVNGTFSFHYDESLANLDLDLTARLTMMGWRSFDLGYHFVD